MGTRKQEGNSLRTIYDASISRRVCFYKHTDESFGFLEWKFSVEDDSWLPTEVGPGSRLGTLDDAIREAKGRIGWLEAMFASK